MNITEYMTPRTRLPPYMPFARFLLKTDLSLTAKIVYSLLLDRMTLSQKNNWVDEEGHVYVLYPIENIADDIDRGKSSVKSALTELEDHGLIKKQRTGFSGPNRIYVLLPDSHDSDPMTVGNPPLTESENRPSYSRNSDLMRAGKPTVNNLNNNNRIKPPERDKDLSVYGRYENVFLTEGEYDSLKEECPDADRLIEDLSAYMKSTGKTYADHAATIRLWSERTNPDLPDYTSNKGDSL